MKLARPLAAILAVGSLAASAGCSAPQDPDPVGAPVFTVEVSE